jgi:hypothetical protein
MLPPLRSRAVHVLRLPTLPSSCVLLPFSLLPHSTIPPAQPPIETVACASSATARWRHAARKRACTARPKRTRAVISLHQPWSFVRIPSTTAPAAGPCAYRNAGGLEEARVLRHVKRVGAVNVGAVEGEAAREERAEGLELIVATPPIEEAEEALAGAAHAGLRPRVQRVQALTKYADAAAAIQHRRNRLHI